MSRQAFLLAQSPERAVEQFGLRDIDEAVIKHFEEVFSSETNSGIPVPVRFSAGERWALDRDVHLRDADGRLALPVISVSRGSPRYPSMAAIPGDAFEIVVGSKPAVDAQAAIREFADGTSPATTNLGGFDFASTQTAVDFGSQPLAVDFLVCDFPSMIELDYKITFQSDLFSDKNRFAELLLKSRTWRSLVALSGSRGQVYQGEFGEELSEEGTLEDQGESKRIFGVSAELKVYGWLITRPRIVRKVYDKRRLRSPSRIRWEATASPRD